VYDGELINQHVGVLGRQPLRVGAPTGRAAEGRSAQGGRNGDEVAGAIPHSIRSRQNEVMMGQLGGTAQKVV